MMNTQFFLIILFCIFTLNLVGQSEILYEAGHKIEMLREQDGVIKQEVGGILEDSKGYIWIANLDYLLKYDGYRFHKYKLPKKQEFPKIGQNNLRFLEEDKEGNIWISTLRAGGLIRFNPEKGVFTRVKTEGNNKPLSHNSTVAFSKDDNGNVWMGSTFGINKIKPNGNQFEIAKFTPTIFSLASKEYIDSLSLIDGKLIQRIQGVGDYEDRTEMFELKHPKKILIINVGESYHGDRDYGWLENDRGDEIWSFDFSKSICAGGSILNRIQIDTLSLPIGKYYLKFTSAYGHSYNKWNDPPPIVPEWWGIQVLEASGIDLNKAYQKEQNKDTQNFDQAINTFPFKDKNGKQYVIANSKIYQIDYKENEQITFILKNKDLEGYQVRGIEVGNKNHLWIITDSYSPHKKSLFRYSINEHKMMEINHGLPQLRQGRAHLEEDLKGNLWLGFANYR